MSKVFPERMNVLDYSDVEGCLRIIDSYIRNMCEKIDFSIMGISKEVGIDVTNNVYKLEEKITSVEGEATSALAKANLALGGLEDKVDKVAGKGLSTEDFTTAYKTILDNLKPYSFVGMIVQSTTLSQESQLKAIYGNDTRWLKHDGYLLMSSATGVTANQAQEDNTVSLTAGTDTDIKSKNIYVWERIL